MSDERSWGTAWYHGQVTGAVDPNSMAQTAGALARRAEDERNAEEERRIENQKINDVNKYIVNVSQDGDHASHSAKISNEDWSGKNLKSIKNGARLLIIGIILLAPFFIYQSNVTIVSALIGVVMLGKAVVDVIDSAINLYWPLWLTVVILALSLIFGENHSKVDGVTNAPPVLERSPIRLHSRNF